MDDYLVKPDPADPALTRRIAGRDHEGRRIEAPVTVERPLTLFLNGQEIVTMMTIGDRPDCLAVGYLMNQGMLRADDAILAIDHDDDTGTVVVRTARRTDYEARLRKKTLTSGCAQGTVFGDLMDEFEAIRFPPGARMRTSWLYALAKAIATTPSLYLEAGAIHGCVLCERDRPLLYMEDVGRHNAVDKIAGYMALHGIGAAGKSFYTTGRLTSEMVIKAAKMGLPILMSRSGFTAWGVELARQVGMTLIGRLRGRRFLVLAGEERLLYDAAPGPATPAERGSRHEESTPAQRGSRHEEPTPAERGPRREEPAPAGRGPRHGEPAGARAGAGDG